MYDYISSARKVAEHAEVFVNRTRRTPVRFEANRLKHVQTKESTTVALRIIKGGRIGFAVGNGSIPAETLAAMAVETVPFGPEASFELPEAHPCPSVKVFDAGVEDFPVEEMVRLGLDLIERLRGHTPDVLCEGNVSKQVSEVYLVNSRGLEVTYQRSVFSVNMEGVLVREGDLLFVGDGQSSCRLIADCSEVADNIIRQLEYARVLTRLESKTVPVVFTPIGVASTLVAPLSVAFNGKRIVDGSSPLKGRQGEKVFDVRFNLWDDATIDFQPGSCPWDDEGVPSQRTPLVEQGIVRGFLFDLQTARQAGARSTGSGRRGGGLPSPGSSSVIIGEGRVPFGEIMKQIKEGLLVEFTMGAEQGNLLSGDFAGNVLLGFAIRNGEVVGRVKDTVVSGNVYKIFGDIGAISSEARWV
ncbi:MAG: TldD/PmbA family protein, partial [Dehalococcoidia bacterium]|nr:TldD/PmbA family protein [Dehalococcoidia bacterium]